MLAGTLIVMAGVILLAYLASYLGRPNRPPKKVKTRNS